MKKIGPTICCPLKIHLISKDITRLKVKRRKDICNTNSNQKRAEATIGISYKIDIKSKLLQETKKNFIY